MTCFALILCNLDKIPPNLRNFLAHQKQQGREIMKYADRKQPMGADVHYTIHFTMVY